GAGRRGCSCSAGRGPGAEGAGGRLLRQGPGDDRGPASEGEPGAPAPRGGPGLRSARRSLPHPGRDRRRRSVTLLAALILVSTPPLEAEIDSQTREDDELPPASVIPYTPRFEGKTLQGLVCGPEVKNGSVRKLLKDGTRLTDSKDLGEVKRAV